MPTLRKDIVKKELKKAGISLAKMGRELGFKSRVTFYNHFEKDDIDLDLYNSIIMKLIEKGATVDESITVKTGKLSYIGGGIGNRNDSGTALDDLKNQLAEASANAKTFERLYRESLLRIAELERKAK